MKRIQMLSLTFTILVLSSCAMDGFKDTSEELLKSVNSLQTFDINSEENLSLLKEKTYQITCFEDKDLENKYKDADKLSKKVAARSRTTMKEAIEVIDAFANPRDVTAEEIADLEEYIDEVQDDITAIGAELCEAPFNRVRPENGFDAVYDEIITSLETLKTSRGDTDSTTVGYHLSGMKTAKATYSDNKLKIEYYAIDNDKDKAVYENLRVALIEYRDTVKSIPLTGAATVHKTDSERIPLIKAFTKVTSAYTSLPINTLYEKYTFTQYRNRV